MKSEEMTLDELVARGVELTGQRVRAKANGDREAVARIRCEQLEVNQWILLRTERVAPRAGLVVRPRGIK